MKAITILAATCLLVGLAPLAGANESGTGSGTGVHPSGTTGGEKPSTSLPEWLQEYRKNNPKRFDELMKLQKTNPDEFGRRMREIYLEHHANTSPTGTDQPGSGGTTKPYPGPHGGDGTKPFPPHPGTETNTAASSLGTPATSIPSTPAVTPAPMAQSGTGVWNGERPKWMERLIARLRDENPERFDALKKLRDDNPQAFHEEMTKLVAQKRDEFVGRNFGSGEGKIAELARQYRDATDPKTKDQLKSQVRDQLGKSFDERIDKQSTHLQELEKQLGDLRQQIATRKAQRDAILQQHLDNVLEGDVATGTPANGPTATTGTGTATGN